MLLRLQTCTEQYAVQQKEARESDRESDRMTACGTKGEGKDDARAIALARSPDGARSFSRTDAGKDSRK